ncbi:MAG: putative toxin-antitoxin system toxin component, PIN family [Chitinispirillales bacterium]|jgi:putative PIN family toxin of toxin-antitoxin system|nr:putative toxin-antitoxin system toxin component, PIN family [Chitinispirillales bacterium]
MKTVLDVNMFVSAYLYGGVPKAVLKRAVRMLDTLFITDDILADIEKTFRKPKFDLSNENVVSFLDDIRKYARKVIVSPQHKAVGVCRDADDDKILECAHAAQADYIITGDNDLLDLKKHHSVKIITARKYLDIVTLS